VKNILLLGGGGFIGSNLARFLKKQGHNVTIYDRNIKQKRFPGPFFFIEGDFFKENNLVELIRNQDVVVHLISSVIPASSTQHTEKAYSQDILKTLELIECCRDNGVKKIVFLSSGGTIYGRNYHSPITETSSTNPINHYGIMKLTIEKILLMHNNIYGMQNVILRVANPYGQGQNPSKKIGAVTVFLDMILNDKTIMIYGNGDIVRDYIEISDVVLALEAGIQSDISKYVEPVFNVGTGKGTSISELISLIESISGKKAKINYVEERGIDVKYNVLDTTKTSNILNFNPKIDIAQGIRSLLGKETFPSYGSLLKDE
jgi:UDP-glucose 4-epimerase